LRRRTPAAGDDVASDLQDIQHGYPFVLTAEEIGQYDVKYVGRQKVDEVDCYVFDVSPKVIEKKKRYLLGRIWVDTDRPADRGDQRPHGSRRHAQGQRRPASALHDLAAAGGRALSGSRSTPRAREFCTFSRWQRLHGAGRAHPRHDQVLRLQAVRLDNKIIYDGQDISRGVQVGGELSDNSAATKTR
jgi:hypothetical protein